MLTSFLRKPGFMIIAKKKLDKAKQKMIIFSSGLSKLSAFWLHNLKNSKKYSVLHKLTYQSNGQTLKIIQFLTFKPNKLSML
jgi:hypothetical protein